MKAFDRIVSFYPQLADRRKDFFSYTIDYNTIAASAVSAENGFNVDSERDFVVLELSYVMATAAAGTAEQAYPSVTIQIADASSGMNWLSAPTHLMNLFGKLASGAAGGTGVHELPHPRWVSAGSRVTTSVTNLEANARRLWLSFHGCLIYRGLQ